MKKYVCDVCGWVYDEELGDAENGIAPGTKFEDLPDDFVCPLCAVGKENFSETDSFSRHRQRLKTVPSFIFFTVNFNQLTERH